MPNVLFTLKTEKLVTDGDEHKAKKSKGIFN